jgi:hypothetical protein
VPEKNYAFDLQLHGEIIPEVRRDLTCLLWGVLAQ